MELCKRKGQGPGQSQGQESPVAKVSAKPNRSNRLLEKSRKILLEVEKLKLRTLRTKFHRLIILFRSLKKELKIQNKLL
jgi:hypothetical protein